MRVISLSATLALEQGVSAQSSEIALVRFRTPDLATTIRLASGSTRRISTDPLEYGVRSNWLTDDPVADPFKMVLMSARMPDDTDDGQGEVQIVFDLAPPGTVDLMRSFSGMAVVDIAVVLNTSPDHVEFELLDMLMVGAESSGGLLTFSIVADPMEEEIFPFIRGTRTRQPGLFP